VNCVYHFAFQAMGKQKINMRVLSSLNNPPDAL